jgi:hypothetical protein
VTPEQEMEFLDLATREVDALERLADYFAPKSPAQPKRPAVLSTATYTAEEREKLELRKVLSGKKS